MTRLLEFPRWRVVLVALFLLGLAIGLFGQAVSLSKRHWTAYQSVSLSNTSDGSLKFVFPTSASSAIGYLYTTSGPSVLSGVLTVRYRVETVGFPTFRYDTEASNTCISPAKVRPFFGRYQQRQKKLAFSNRWWPQDYALEIQAGDGEIAVPLDDSAAVWVKVFDWQDFDADRMNADLLGLSFGGGCFYAHGVYTAGGSASFVLVEMTVG